MTPGRSAGSTCGWLGSSWTRGRQGHFIAFYSSDFVDYLQRDDFSTHEKKKPTIANGAKNNAPNYSRLPGDRFVTVHPVISKRNGATIRSDSLNVSRGNKWCLRTSAVELGRLPHTGRVGKIPSSDKDQGRLIRARSRMQSYRPVKGR